MKAALLTLLAIALNIPVQASEADALAISANIQAKHFPYVGILDPIYASSTSNQISDYTRCGDSALWTGAYLAAESFRYKVTGSQDALNNATKAISGIKSLLDVTGNNLLARCMAPVGSPYQASISSQEAANGIYTNSSAGWIWVGNTSRDQYIGVIFGLGVAYDMIDDPAVKSSISDIVTRTVQFLTGHNWSVVMPDGSSSTTFLVRPEEMLDLVQVGRHVNNGAFGTYYDELRISLGLTGTILAPVGVDVIDDSSYFKFNLDYMTFYNLNRLEGSSAGAVYGQAYQIVRNHTAGHKNAFFDIIDRALNGANGTRDAEAVALLDQWLERPRRDPAVDLTKTVPVCNGQACSPIPVPLRVPTDFVWQRSPFQLAGGGSNTIETAGIDYILPYWMGRYYGVIPAVSVESSAASISMVAPGSLASIFGANLATQTAQANALPLPLTLGGVSLTVKDAAGNTLQAPLLYVSPVQINFEVPTGTALGEATLTLNGSATPLVSANVMQVAPALFSVNGAGTGVAAATAIRTQAGNPQLQSSVPVFQCAGSTCTPVPINVGLDTPVYLTLYGTGIRGVTALSNVSVTINGISVPVLYAGAQPNFPGLDQVNVPLTLNLRGSGVSNVVLTVNGQPANVVTIDIQ